MRRQGVPSGRLFHTRSISQPRTKAFDGVAVCCQIGDFMTQFAQSIGTVTLAGARCIRDHALERATALGLSVALVIIDRTGVIKLAETMDNAPAGASEAALMKARGAARYLAPTHLTAEFIKTLPAQLAQHALSLPDLCAFQGGVPIKVGEQCVGGLGISGGTGAQDVEIALQAAAAIT